MSGRQGYPGERGVISVARKGESILAWNELNELEAWSFVRKALRNSGYHANEEFEKLPPIVRKAVGSPDNLYCWSQMDITSVENIVQVNFLQVYRMAVNQEEKAVGIVGRSNTEICIR